MSISKITPESFLHAYSDGIRELGTWAAYQQTSLWTPIAKSAAELACSSLGLQYSREYFRVDVIGWTGSSECDWDLRVAFEAEDSNKWEEEICKLCHVVADLRVVVAYQSSKSRRCEDMLAAFVENHKRRMARVPHCDWLFIFGPHVKMRDDCWSAYTLNTDVRPIAVTGHIPLRGSDMRD